MSRKIIVYGGRGALGSTCVNYFKSKNFWVGSIDITENAEADKNILVGRDDDLVSQETQVLEAVKSLLNEDKLDAIFCVAGGWAGGSATRNLAKNTDLMLKQSVWSSIISASVASKFLKENGVLTLTGAEAALNGTPKMIGYGMAKSAVHHLTKSLSMPGSGMPANSFTASILPVTLDTPMNRKWMSNADFSSWTPLEFIAETFHKWIEAPIERPPSGSLVKLITKDSETKLVTVE